MVFCYNEQLGFSPSFVTSSSLPYPTSVGSLPSLACERYTISKGRSPGWSFIPCAASSHLEIELSSLDLDIRSRISMLRVRDSIRYHPLQRYRQSLYEINYVALNFELFVHRRHQRTRTSSLLPSTSYSTT